METQGLSNKKDKAISKEEAISMAKIECEKQDWPWLEPVIAKSWFGDWVIITNSKSRGLNAKIIIHKRTGIIKASNFFQR